MTTTPPDAPVPPDSRFPPNSPVQPDASDGSEETVTVTFLEMTEAPAGPPPPLPVGAQVAILKADDAPVAWFLYLYGEVGQDWEWTDWLKAPRAELEAFVAHPEVTIHTLMVEGWPGGFFMLDTREPGVCDLAFFGLVPQAIGRGLGRWLLGTAIRTGWERPGVEKLTVNTCTLDHPAALGLYQRMGFAPVRREEHPR